MKCKIKSVYPQFTYPFLHFYILSNFDMFSHLLYIQSAESSLRGFEIKARRHPLNDSVKCYRTRGKALCINGIKVLTLKDGVSNCGRIMFTLRCMLFINAPKYLTVNIYLWWSLQKFFGRPDMALSGT